DGVDVELDHVAVRIEQIDAVGDLMIGEASDGKAGAGAAVIARDQLRLAFDLPGDVVEARLGADLLRDLQVAVPAVAILALGRLDAADIVRRVAGAEKAASEVGLDEFQRQAANRMIKLGRATEILDEEIDVPEAPRVKDRALDIAKHRRGPSALSFAGVILTKIDCASKIVRHAPRGEKHCTERRNAWA